MTPVSRRTFLAKSIGGVAAVSGVTVPAIRAVADSPSERVSVAVIGLNGMGGGHVRRLVAGKKDARVTALCDVDAAVRRRGRDVVVEGAGEMPELSGDFLRVLDDKSIDAVVIATPHHWHVPIALGAVQAGKDCYVEKPMSHVFREGRLLLDASRKHGRIIQHGTQTRSSPVFEEAGEVLASGIIGEVRMSKAWNLQEHRPLAPKPDGKAPAGVDYDRWLGPAPERAFNPNRFHGSWRQYRDYGNGDIGDDGAHDVDIARWGLGVATHPVRVTAHGSRTHLKGEREYPDNMLVAYKYADGRVLIYEDRMWTPYGEYGFDSGNAFYGTEGRMIFSRRGHFQVYLGKKDEKGPGMSRATARAKDHMADFLDSVRTRKPPRAPADVAHLTCGLIHLGEIAYRLERVLHFDPDREQFRNDAEAHALLTKSYRTPWDVTDAI